MPNHVHAVIEQAQGHSLGRVVHSWESFTAHEINKVNQTKGLIWAEDYFDRFIRDDVHLANAVGYVENNPVKAGLVKKPEQWPYSSATRRSG
jgi:REP element-mobilizing transposase RayT